MSKPPSNLKVVVGLVAIVAAMTVLVAYSVPLYRLFCQVTGFGGTTQTAETAPGDVGAGSVTVRFNADISPDLFWTFSPVDRSVTVALGEEKTIHYRAKNNTDRPLAGTAIFNVTPQKVGIYFNKLECFCFTEQLLQPGEEVLMPVVFFVDPEITADPNTREVKTMTLSYTFFPVAETGEEKEGDPLASLPAENMVMHDHDHARDDHPVASLEGAAR